MNDIISFKNTDFGEVRVVEFNGEPWFVGKDLATILGYSNPRKAIIDHVDNEDKTDGVTIRDSIGREQNPTVINESGLYSLILSSKLPTAKKFKHWVTSEVLPAIRKTGAYSTKLPQTFAEALRLAADQQELIEKQQKQIGTMAPKADFADQAFRLDNRINIGTCGKVLGLPFGRNTLFRKLRERGVFFSNRNEPKQKYVDAGYFVMSEHRVLRGSTDFIVNVTYATQKGLAYIGYLFGKKPNEQQTATLFAQALQIDAQERDNNINN